MTADDLTAIRRQLAEGQSLVRETVDRLRQSQEENEMIVRRRDELESRVATLEADYEELLGNLPIRLCVYLRSFPMQRRPFMKRRPVTLISRSPWRISR